MELKYHCQSPASTHHDDSFMCRCGEYQQTLGSVQPHMPRDALALYYWPAYT